MTLWAVRIERTEEATIYVDAEGKTEAIEAARELRYDVFDGSWEDFEYDETAYTTDRIPNGEQVWVGGESGKWLTPEQYGEAS